MRTDEVKQINSSNQGIYITVKSGLLVLIDDEREKELFRKALKTKRAFDIIRDKQDEEFL